MLRLKVTDLLFRCGRIRLNLDIRIKIVHSSSSCNHLMDGPLSDSCFLYFHFSSFLKTVIKVCLL